MANDRFIETTETVYRNSKYVISREYGLDPNGNPFRGMWVVRVLETGEYVEHSMYQHGLSEKFR